MITVGFGLLNGPTMKPSKSLLAYYGGKAGQIGRDTAAVLDSIPHRVYAELFGGMASVLLYKKPVIEQIYNDLNSNIVNLFRVLRDEKKQKQLARLHFYTPYSRAEWSYACAHYQDKENFSDVERARMMMCVLGQGALGRLYRKSWGCGSPNYGTNMSQSWFRKLERYEYVAERFRSVMLECQPAEKLAVRWDKDGVLQYWDPPYVPGTRSKGGDYVFETDVAFHEKMVQTALSMQRAMVVIAGYPQPDLPAEQRVYQPLEDAGWLRVDFKAKAEAAKKSGTDIERIESIWISPNCNYVPPSPNLQPSHVQAALAF
jgi:DNA adenine methylase